MGTGTGHTLYGRNDEELGQIVDVLGLDAGTEDVAWLSVKVGWRTTCLVPDAGLEARDDGFALPVTKEQITSAPKVPPHFEPAGHDREALLSHYGVRLAGL